MTYNNLSYCANCGALFVKAVRDICNKCSELVEEDYKKCEKYLRKRENRGANIYQLSEATGVDVKQITKFIREGRISIAENSNLGYPCEKCGNPITTGTYCDYCSKGFKRSIEQQMEVDKRLEEEKKRSSAIGYRSKSIGDL